MSNFEASNFEISRFIFHFRRLKDKYFLSTGFHKTCKCFPHFLLDIPSSVRRIFSKCWFPHNLSFFQISRNCKNSKLCFPHFLFDVPSSVRQIKISTDFKGLKKKFDRTCNFFEKVNCQNFIHYTDPALRPGLKPQVKWHLSKVRVCHQPEVVNDLCNISCTLLLSQIYRNFVLWWLSERERITTNRLGGVKRRITKPYLDLVCQKIL